ncbi:MAG: hypothetical protein ABEJ78_07365 [Haloferacaceae archaeon]
MSRPPDDDADAGTDTPPESAASDADDASTVDSESRGDAAAIDDYLPDATVDSGWWYWIAAVPVFFVLSAAFGVVFVGTAVLGLFVGDGGGVVLLFVLAGLFALVGLVLSVLFPLAVYVDAKAVSAATVDWDPDPVLYGLVALAGVLMTAFVVSVPLACYYLYRRHGAVGVP